MTGHAGQGLAAADRAAGGHVDCYGVVLLWEVKRKFLYKHWNEKGNLGIKFLDGRHNDLEFGDMKCTPIKKKESVFLVIYGLDWKIIDCFFTWMSSIFSLKKIEVGGKSNGKVYTVVVVDIEDISNIKRIKVYML